jgi:class 3 adenylate cyclase
LDARSSNILFKPMQLGGARDGRDPRPLRQQPGGDPVKVASRLQGLTKSLGCEVLMSEEVYGRPGDLRNASDRAARLQARFGR